MVKLTRRDVLTTAGTGIAALYGMSTSAAASISYKIRNTFIIPDGELRTPNAFSYDMYEWQADGNDWGVLEFEDPDYAEFGDENYPPSGPSGSTENDLASGPSGSTKIDLATQINLPLSLNFYTMNIGVAIFLVGIQGVLLGAVHLFKNYAAGIMWGIGAILLVLAGLLDVSLELYWLSVAMTFILLVAGLAARWGRQ